VKFNSIRLFETAWITFPVAEKPHMAPFAMRFSICFKEEWFKTGRFCFRPELCENATNAQFVHHSKPNLNIPAVKRGLVIMLAC